MAYLSGNRLPEEGTTVNEAGWNRLGEAVQSFFKRSPPLNFMWVQPKGCYHISTHEYVTKHAHHYIIIDGNNCVVRKKSVPHYPYPDILQVCNFSIVAKLLLLVLELLVSWPVETATCRPYPPAATIACATTWTTFRTLS